MPTPTPVEIWAPAFFAAGFRWLKEMPVAEILSGPAIYGPLSGLYACKLCESARVRHRDLDSHARQHRNEYRDWLEAHKREEREAHRLEAQMSTE
jgi:hypothetical protein